jgi:hypothetical protein
MNNDNQPEELITPKIAKMIDELSKDSICDIFSTPEKIKKLFSKTAEEMAEDLIRQDKKKTVINLEGELREI